MLTVQPKILNSQSFAARYNADDVNFKNFEENEYLQARKELQDQLDNFNQLASDDEFKAPKVLKKVLTGGAILTTGLLGGMATGWGTKKSIQGIQELLKTKTVKGIKGNIQKYKNVIIEQAKALKTKFLSSDFYEKLSKKAIDSYAKLKENKYLKPVIEFLEKTGKWIKKGYVAIKTGVNHVIDGIKGVKKETWEKGTTNVVGFSGGIAAGVEAAKKKSEEKE